MHKLFEFIHKFCETVRELMKTAYDSFQKPFFSLFSEVL